MGLGPLHRSQSSLAISFRRRLARPLCPAGVCLCVSVCVKEKKASFLFVYFSVGGISLIGEA